ncbi:MAG: tetratricopeptide repeat protein [Nitrospirales bacterium]|nr:tetratricopeptide repeat protein [Nitrospirales bacterium]MDR4481977.1 tetratricopeptide repeat protein [Nitrospirales bacterium]
MTPVHNTKQEKLKPDWVKIAHTVRSPHRYCVVVMACLALALGYFGFAQLATAHSGLDSEIQEITEKLVKDPDNVDLLVHRGQVYRSNGKYIESLLDLERAWLQNRENRTVVLQRALTLSALGRDKEAESALDYFLQEESDPKRVFALAERATIHARNGQTELAITDFTSAIQLQPTIELYLVRGKLQESLGRLEDAAAGYQDGLTKLGDAILLKKGLIRVRMAQSQYREALALVDEEITGSSVKTSWHLQRAKILDHLGRPDEARLAYEQALAEANRVLGKRQTAMQLLARAEVYQAMGRMEEAKNDLRVAIQKTPHFAEADDLLRKLESQ